MANLCSAIRATLGQRQIRQSPGIALNAHSGNEWGKIPVLTGQPPRPRQKRVIAGDLQIQTQNSVFELVYSALSFGLGCVTAPYKSSYYYYYYCSSFRCSVLSFSFFPVTDIYNTTTYISMKIFYNCFLNRNYNNCKYDNLYSTVSSKLLLR